MILLSDMVSLYALSAALSQFLFCECVSPRLFHFVEGPTCIGPGTGSCKWVRCPCPVLSDHFTPSVGACVLLSSLALTAWLGLVIVVVVVRAHGGVTSFCLVLLPF